MNLPEYYAEAGDAFLLRITIKLFSRVAAEYLSERLTSFAVNVEITPVSNFWLLVVQACSTIDTDRLLAIITEEVDGVNRLPEIAAQAEIMESRLVQDGSVLRTQLVEQLGLVFDSGQAFGTGQHPSTRLAFAALAEVKETEPVFPGRVLDVGCGSGILALACARFGAKFVHGIDVSSEAVLTARRNVLANCLAERIVINDQPLDLITASFDLITANLTASVLTRLAPQFAGRLNPQGLLIVAGIQGRQAEEITAKICQSGCFSVLKEYASGPWRAVLYRLP